MVTIRDRYGAISAVRRVHLIRVVPGARVDQNPKQPLGLILAVTASIDEIGSRR